MRGNATFYEFGEIAKKPISMDRLINHYFKIYSGFRFKGTDYYYINGVVCVARCYHVKQYEGDYISKIRFYRLEF